MSIELFLVVSILPNIPNIATSVLKDTLIFLLHIGYEWQFAHTNGQKHVYSYQQCLCERLSAVDVALLIQSAEKRRAVAVAAKMSHGRSVGSQLRVH